MFKNTASQKITLLAIDTAANVPKTGDAANITAYVAKDDGAVTVLTDTSAAELDATNAPGLYSFDVSQTESNADKLVFSGKSSTSGIKIVPVVIYTHPTGGIASPTNITAGTIATVTTVTNAVTLPATATIAITGNITGNLSGSVGSVAGLTNATIADAVWDEALTDHLTLGTFGYYVGEIHATGDLLYTDWEDGGRLDLILDSRAPAATALSTATWTATRAGYLDNLSGGAVMLASSYYAPPSASTISTQVASDLAAAHGAGSWATATGFSTLDASGVRTAVGLATANLDTQLGDIPTVAEFNARTLVAAAYFDPSTDTVTTSDAASIAAILLDTNELQLDWANGGRLDLILDSRASQTSVDDVPTNTELATALASADDATIAAIAALNNLSAAQVNAECDTALSDAGVTLARMGALTDWIDGGRLDAILDTIASNVAAVLLDTGTDGVALSAALCNKIADHVRRRTQANVEASSDGDTLSKSSQYGAIQQIQKSNTTDTAGLLTIKKTDGTTLGTLTLTSDAAADPATGVS